MNDQDTMTRKAAQALADLPIRGHALTIDDLAIIWIDGYATGHHDGTAAMSDKAIEILEQELNHPQESQP